ncbi:MAG: hypothetical protein JXB26_20365 [Candidatus Aminicenantes bacterium]|nr:hypothetical protein [Candidatus Aminicenantes bacterium]
MKKFSKAEYAKVWINGDETLINQSPQKIYFDTCKFQTGKYYTKLNVKGEVKYNNGKIKDQDYTLDLTTGWADREDTAQTYSIFVAHDNDSDFETMLDEAAAEFVDRFSAYSKSLFTWASPGYFTTGIGQGRDLLIFLGHGNHHKYKAGSHNSDWVDLSTVAFGDFSICDMYTDVEYLVLFSCDTLCMDNYSGVTPFGELWFNNHNNRLQKRPFMGVHEILGFNHFWTITETCFLACSDDGDDFWGAFADYLDGGTCVRLAWLWAIMDELSIEVGENEGVVFYLLEYENDSVYDTKNDYIHGNPKYDGMGYVNYIVVN